MEQCSWQGVGFDSHFNQQPWCNMGYLGTALDFLLPIALSPGWAINTRKYLWILFISVCVAELKVDSQREGCKHRAGKSSEMGNCDLKL